MFSSAPSGFVRSKLVAYNVSNLSVKEWWGGGQKGKMKKQDEGNRHEKGKGCSLLSTLGNILTLASGRVRVYEYRAPENAPSGATVRGRSGVLDFLPERNRSGRKVHADGGAEANEEERILHFTLSLPLRAAVRIHCDYIVSLGFIVRPAHRGHNRVSLFEGRRFTPFHRRDFPTTGAPHWARRAPEGAADPRRRERGRGRNADPSRGAISREIYTIPPRAGVTIFRARWYVTMRRNCANIPSLLPRMRGVGCLLSLG